ncbi:hypothetical protein J2792_002378 [Novosphingobium capsulatum]|jgi:hypothetical protein|uniref:Uncharacterized protein n=1 Tax=Novosphingobium capsulatum TaxID=13688 RepID=A0ABU1MNA6_9SPHN|nr:hypothetical protein [Novosphingobium capsulatum]
MAVPENLDWNPVKTAPWEKVVWVRNPAMNEPVLATRGYAHNGVVRRDSTLFTTPAGWLCLPTEWAEYSEGGAA